MDVRNGIGGVVRGNSPTLRVAIKAIYKSGTLCPVNTQRCDLATAKVGLHTTILKWPLLLRFV